jgi:hypothetical protein
MNKQIHRLAKQAFDVANDGAITDIKIPKLFVEMFADLIIKECASRVASKASHWGNMTDDIINECILECATDLKQHFGVEE